MANLSKAMRNLEVDIRVEYERLMERTNSQTMAGYEGAKKWIKLAFLFFIWGFGLECFAMSSGLVGGYDSVHAMMIIGFMCYLTGALLIVLLLYFPDLENNKAVCISIIVFGYVSAGLTILGLIMWYTNDHWHRNKIVPVYSTTLATVGAAFAVLGSTFTLVHVTDDCKCCK